jgi:hypothetical protein
LPPAAPEAAALLLVAGLEAAALLLAAEDDEEDDDEVVFLSLPQAARNPLAGPTIRPAATARCSSWRRLRPIGSVDSGIVLSSVLGYSGTPG